jgi:anti-sigma B factor antagonist
MASVDVSIRDAGGQPVVVVRGELDLAAAPGAASHLIAAVVACGPLAIVDLAGLESLGSGGLGVLVRLLKWAREAGGDMCLAGPQLQVRRVLGGTGLTDVFSVFPTVEQAAGSARRAQPALPAAPQSRVAVVMRPGGRLPPYCAAGRPPLWRQPGHGTCRARRMVRDACRQWRRGTWVPGQLPGCRSGRGRAAGASGS